MEDPLVFMLKSAIEIAVADDDIAVVIAAVHGGC